MTAASIPLVVLLTLAQLLLVWNVVQTLRGRTSAGTQRETLGVAKPRLTSPALQGFVVVITIAGLFGLAAAGWAIGRSGQNEAAAAFVPAAAPAAGESSAEAAGRQVYMDSGCGGCHALAAAGSTGAVGPDLDQAAPSEALVVDRVTNGKGAMPAFGSQLTPDQIAAVAAFVSSATGGRP